jgi:NAD(P)-dependent dehydrogenase (short-subunit alcohol dehydrogenase family)
MTVRQDRWALILGASVGTGAAIAAVIAEDPTFKVIGFHRGNHPEEAQDLVDAARSAGGEIVLCEHDAGDPNQIEACMDSVRRYVPEGGIKLFVHSLSGASLGHFLQHDGAAETDQLAPWQFEKTFNYLAHSFPYWGRQLHEASLLAPEARLLGLTNALEQQMLHNCGLIAAAKAALEMYVRYLSAELGRYGHRVNLLRFGSVITPALATMLGPEALREFEDVHKNLLAAGRTCTAEEVARMVVLLTHEDTAWFNGATIDFTGGLTQRLLDVVYNPDWIL